MQGSAIRLPSAEHAHAGFNCFFVSVVDVAVIHIIHVIVQTVLWFLLSCVQLLCFCSLSNFARAIVNAPVVKLAVPVAVLLCVVFVVARWCL